VLDSLFMDAIGPSLERLRAQNALVLHGGDAPPQRFGRPLRHIDACLLAPSVDLRELAARHSGRFPRPVRRLLRGIGALGQLSPLPSYLLFDGAFCSELMDLGYADAERRKDTIMATLVGPGIEES
jgi:NTE family protein